MRISPLFLFLVVVLLFSGVVSIDVELSSMDINQCDAQPSSLADGREETGNSDRTESSDSVELLEFLGTHKCKSSTKVTVKSC